MSNLFEHCRAEVSKTELKIRKVGRRSKRKFDYSETQPSITTKNGLHRLQSVFNRKSASAGLSAPYSLLLFLIDSGIRSNESGVAMNHDE